MSCYMLIMSCYMTACQPLTAWTDRSVYISIFRLPREHIYRGSKNNNDNNGNGSMMQVRQCHRALSVVGDVLPSSHGKRVKRPPAVLPQQRYDTIRYIYVRSN